VGELSTSGRGRSVWPTPWRRYFEFIRKPDLPKKSEPFSWQSVGDVGWLVLLEILLTAVFVGLLSLLEALGVSLPQDKLKLDSAKLYVVAILIAPAIEEFLFRFWLKGRRIDFTLLFGVVMLIAVISFLSTYLGGLERSELTALLLGWAIVMTMELVFGWKHRNSVPAVYHKLFPTALWCSSVVFAFLHVFNYAGEIQPILIIMVMPQFVSSTLFAFARLRHGMWANIGMHSLHNAVGVLLALALG
jgi:membrane protease YdiL (CAAX protease family)